jgi:5'-deoxynucleotidase YfbR-like HD superfamily hydrolase
MPSIFVSYARSDRACVQTIIQRLMAHNGSYEIFWDEDIEPGSQYRTVIQDKINTAAVVLVLWSANSIISEWVQSEASAALTKNTIFPIKIDDVTIPPPFDNRHTEDLIGIRTGDQEAKLSKILERLEKRLSLFSFDQSPFFLPKVTLVLGGFSTNDPLLKKCRNPSINETRYELCRYELLKQYSEDEFNSQSEQILRDFMEPKDDLLPIDQRDAKSAFFLAQHIVSTFGTIGRSIIQGESYSGNIGHSPPIPIQQRSLDLLGRIYLNPVNEFVRDLISIINNRDIAKRFGITAQEEHLAKAAKQILEEIKFETKFSSLRRAPHIHAAYILGRVSNIYRADRTLAEIEKVIGKQLEATTIDIDTERHLRLFRRTVLLSQAKLGGRKALQRYIELLHSSYLEMDINAGFHLEYYCDQPSQNYQELCNTDSGENCFNTVSYLLASLQTKLGSGGKGMSQPFTIIEIFTLASILARRVYKGRAGRDSEILKEALTTLEWANKCLEGFEDDPEAMPITDSDLYIDSRIFVQLLLDVANSEQDYAIKELGRFFAAKNAPRNGWITRGVQVPETVGGHTIGLIWLTNLLSYYKQTDAYSELGLEHLDLEKLRRMIEFHDIAEGITGDIPHASHNAVTREQERRLMRRFSWLGIYVKPTLDLYEAYTLYDEFTKQVTLVSRIAHDLDSLDIVIQGKSILESRSSCGDRAQLNCLVREAESRITTRQIKKLLPLAKKINMISSESFAHTPASYVKDYYFPD